MARRRLNWAAILPYLLGFVGAVSVRHTRRHTWPVLLRLDLRLRGELFYLGRTLFQLRLTNYAASRTIKLK